MVCVAGDTIVVVVATGVVVVGADGTVVVDPPGNVVVVIPATDVVVVDAMGPVVVGPTGDVVVVVLPVSQAVPVQASQQLGQTVTVPPFAAHRAALFASLQTVEPPFGIQHDTNPGLPHVERAAQDATSRLQRFGSVPPRTRARTIRALQAR